MQTIRAVIMAVYFFLKQGWNRYIIMLGQMNEMINKDI